MAQAFRIHRLPDQAVNMVGRENGNILLLQCRVFPAEARNDGIAHLLRLPGNALQKIAALLKAPNQYAEDEGFGAAVQGGSIGLVIVFLHQTQNPFPGCRADAVILSVNDLGNR